jgi:hypothetical protein
MSADDYRVWLAFDEAIDGRVDRAERLLELVDEEELDDVPRVLYGLATALIQLIHDGRDAFQSARDKGIETIRQFAQKQPDPDLQHSYRRWAHRMASVAGGIGPWLWYQLKGKKLPQD